MRLLLVILLFASCGGDELFCATVPKGIYEITYSLISSECIGFNKTLTVMEELSKDNILSKCGRHDRVVREFSGADCYVTTEERLLSNDNGFSGKATAHLRCGPFGVSLGLPERCKATYNVVGIPVKGNSDG